MSSYVDYMPSVAPPWLRRNVGDKYWQAVGQMLDAEAQRFRDATLASFPDDAPADALDAIGRDRGLPRAAGEGDAAYRVRLRQAWEAWGGDDTPITGKGGGAGTHLGMLNALRALGLPIGASGMTIVQQNGRYSQLDGAGNLVVGSLMNCVHRLDLTGAINVQPGWTFEGRDTFYSEFGLVFPADVPTLTANSVLAAGVHQAVRKWRPSKALFVGTWIIVAGRTLGWPTGRTLGTEPNLGGNTIRYIEPPGGNEIGYAP